MAAPGRDTAMEYQQIAFERTGRVGVITLNRPEKLNAWTPRMMAEYRDAIARCNADPPAKQTFG